jgi:RNA polymerase sigma-70 factor (ECF subfamily)
MAGGVGVVVVRPPSPASTDAELIALAKEGDHLAFAALLRRHDDKLRGLAYKLLVDRDRMDDALQEAYVKAYRALPKFREGSELSSWLYRITYNACIDELRRAKRNPLAPVQLDETSPEPGPERSVTAADTVRRALAALTDDQRITVVLVDGEGFDNRAAAQILGVAPGTVASRLSRARAILREHLGDPG